MHIAVRSVSDLGLALRAVRRHSAVRLDDLAATVGVSKQFVSDVEHGKPTVQLGLVIRLLEELGLPLMLDLPQDAAAELAALEARGGLRPLCRRGASRPQGTGAAGDKADGG